MKVEVSMSSVSYHKATKAAQTEAEALSRAQSGQSLTNFPTILEGFMARGIAEAEILPRVNVFTYRAWKAKGRQVRNIPFQNPDSIPYLKNQKQVSNPVAYRYNPHRILFLIPQYPKHKKFRIQDLAGQDTAWQPHLCPSFL